MPIAEELVRLSPGGASGGGGGGHELLVQNGGRDGETKKQLNGWATPGGTSMRSVAGSLCGNGGGVGAGARRARLVAKDGRTLLASVQLPAKIRNDIRNWFHLLIECSWRSVMMLFGAGYLGSWLFFGIYYYLIVVGYTYAGRKETCIENVGNLTTAFLFSMESQHTIGYGIRYMTSSCPLAYIGLTCQLIIGMFIQTMLGGLIIAKVLRPKKRRQEMRFSKFAVIGPVDAVSDHRPALMIRLADIQEKLFLAESHVRLYMASTRVNENGDRVLLGVKDMNVGYDSGWDRVLLLWPIVVRHVIDEQSPLHGLTRSTILQQDFELIMTVEGIVEATGMTFQARTSFLPEEVAWGERFKPIVLLNERKREFEIHYNLFELASHLFIAIIHSTDKYTEWLAELEAGGEPAEEENEEHGNASGFL